MSIFDSEKFPFRVKLHCPPRVARQDILSWGQATLGKHQVDWSMLYIDIDLIVREHGTSFEDNRGVIVARFKTEEDASFFTLRWSA